MSNNLVSCKTLVSSSFFRPILSSALESPISMQFHQRVVLCGCRVLFLLQHNPWPRYKSMICQGCPVKQHYPGKHYPCPSAMCVCPRIPCAYIYLMSCPRCVTCVEPSCTVGQEKVERCLCRISLQSCASFG